MRAKVSTSERASAAAALASFWATSESRLLAVSSMPRIRSPSTSMASAAHRALPARANWTMPAIRVLWVNFMGACAGRARVTRATRRSSSGHDLLDDVAEHGGRTLLAALVLERHLAVVQSQLVQDRGLQVVGVDDAGLGAQ